MHRYRDALIHLKKADDGVTEKSRPIVGAFVLYPGWFDEATGVKPYTAAIETVGMGGFPVCRICWQLKTGVTCRIGMLRYWKRVK